MAENPGAVIEDVAHAKNVTARAVIEALPDAMRSFAPGSSFVDAMQEIATWGEVTLIIHTADGIFEVTEPVEVIETPVEVIEEPVEVIEEPVEVIEEPVETVVKPKKVRKPRQPRKKKTE